MKKGSLVDTYIKLAYQGYPEQPQNERRGLMGNMMLGAAAGGAGAAAYPFARGAYNAMGTQGLVGQNWGDRMRTLGGFGTRDGLGTVAKSLGKRGLIGAGVGAVGLPIANWMLGG